MMNLLRKIIFRRYEAERKEATAEIVARFSRGNIRAQNGDYLTSEEAQRLRNKSDKAVEELQKAFTNA